MRLQASKFGFKRTSCLVLAVWLLGSATAQGQQKAAPQTGEPPRAPFLRIETGTHTAPITDISVDDENQYLAASSEDKTSRLWSVSTGQLLRVLRPPIGPGEEGKLTAVGISPDGQTVATGGSAGCESGQACSVYLFDSKSGRLSRRLQGPAKSDLTYWTRAVNRLQYTRDGRYLLAVFGMLRTNSSVRIFGTQTYKPLGGDFDGYLADMTNTGRFAIVTDDGVVRLYQFEPGSGGSPRFIAEKAVSPNPKFLVVNTLSFSPDGLKLLLSFSNFYRSNPAYSGFPLVQVLSSENLAGHYTIPAGEFSFGQWTNGGNAIAALYKNTIREWSNAGRGPHRDIPLPDPRPGHFLPLTDGGYVYSSADTSTIGVVAGDGQSKVVSLPPIANFRMMREQFRVSPDGATLQFSYEPEGRSLARFSLKTRQLEIGMDSTGLLRPAITTATGHPIEAVIKKDPRKANDYSRGGLVFSPDYQKYTSKATLPLSLYDSSGRLWSVEAPSFTTDVNICGNGKYAVMAFTDGTIRWYRISDGKELLAFFPHADRKRWVLWTPSGYYDSAPGAEDLIGWHVNNGRDKEADFFPIGKFRETFYRPDVVARVLETGDEQLALRSMTEEQGRSEQPHATVAEQLPPVVEIISPADGASVNTPEVTLRFRLRTPSGEPVTGVRALLDGRPAPMLAKNGSGDVRELRIAVPSQDVRVSIIAQNRFTASVPETVRLKWTGSAARARIVDGTGGGVADNLKPVLYVLAIGVGKYQNGSIAALTFPAKDANDFAAALLRQKGGLYRDVVVTILTDEKATRDAIVNGLDWIGKETTSRDVAAVFLAGHGDMDRYNNYFFLPYNTDPERLKATIVPHSQIKETVETLAGKVLFFVDTCHSANVIGTSARRGAEVDMNRIVNELSAAENGAVVFTASTGRQFSFENAVWSNGAFTKALVEGLNGSAAVNASRRITIAMLDLYISERVKALTGGNQTPVTRKPDTVPDFPVAVVR